uniref:tail fiber domain-containing protein n=1 Tax=Ekhidna sp. TaxID=2608089 RepID=UPI0035153038
TYTGKTGTNYIDGLASLDAADLALDAAVAGVQSDVDANETASDNADAAIQSELDATQGGAGLNTDGTYTGKTGTNYIDGLASLDAADLALDAAVAGVASTGTAIQSELDATQGGAGLNTDGTYTGKTGTNYIDGLASLDAADLALDAAIKSNEDAIAAGDLTDDQNAGEVGYDNSTSLMSATNVQTAIDEIDGILDGADLTDDQTAAQVTSTATGNIIATNVDAAIAELEAEKQPLDAGLTSISGLTTSANQLIYTTGTDAYAVSTLSAAGRDLIDDTDAATQRTTLGLVIGTDVQAYDADLTTYAGITPSANVQTMLGSTDNATIRSNIGLGSIAIQAANGVNITGGSITGITDLAIADGGTGASTATAARTNLGLGTIATQNANSVTISGGSVTGITDLAIADGGTGASTAANARTNLGLGSLATLNAVSTTQITDGTIANIDISGTAAIAGTKISPNFGTQNVSTSGTLAAGATTVTSLRVSSLSTNGSVTTINGDGTFSVSSDRRLKENIELLQNTLSKLDKLGGYNYNYKADEDKKKQIGVIAQELEIVYPELVQTDERGFKMVNYQGLIPVLIEAIKEQQAEITRLSNQVADQENKLSELASDNKEMKSDLDLIKKMLMGDKTVKNEEE